MYVSDISIEHILKILEPIWQSKTETATRIRERIEAILGYAIANGYRNSSNPAIWKGLLSTQLATPSKIKTVKHQRSICYQETPPFFCKLQKRSSTSAIALIFTILTAARSRMTREAVWEEIDFDQKIWTIPSNKMKNKKAHVIPLSSHAIQLLQSIIPSANTRLIFPSTGDRPLSDMAMNELLKGMKIDAVPHGFRSTFRIWCAEQTNYSRELAEFALAHTINNKTEAAYLRTDLLEKRRDLMQDWANYCYSTEQDIS